MSYVDRGAGSPVLLLHGFPLDHTMWDAQIDGLATHSRVIAPDLRGFGRTPLAAGDAERGITMEAYADDLAAFLDALAVCEPVVLAGFSMGGYIAWQFVQKYASRLAALVVCDTRAVADTEEAREGRLKMAANIAEWGSGRVADIMGPKLFAPATFDNQPEIVARVRRVVENTPTSGIAAAQRGMAARPDVTAMLPSIQLPTLVLVGEHDAISPPAEMRKIAAAIPNAQYVEIPRAGHMTTMEEPGAVNATLAEFVEGMNRKS
jgi:pimeloyl-ACP methyl ester carboxylesterase